MKIFAVSDIHSFYNEFIKALKEQGFEENNPEHLLVCCGDYFDRSNSPYQVMEYLMSLENVVLIKGNHEELMEEMLERGYPCWHDKSNGTWDTFKYLFPYAKIRAKNRKKISPECDAVHDLIKPFYKKMVDYFETENYVFVHGWVPYSKAIETQEADWREGNWSQSRWENGIKINHYGYNPTGKTVVCGHYHCSYGWSHIAQKHKEFPQKTHKDFDLSFQPYYEKGVIAIDACTAYSGKVNVVVLEDNLLEE